MLLPHEVHKNTKHEHAMNMIYVKGMYIKSRSLEIVTNSKAPNMVVVPPKLLDRDAFQKYVHQVHCIHYQGTNPLTFCESPHLHQKHTVGVLVPIVGPRLQSPDLVCFDDYKTY